MADLIRHLKILRRLNQRTVNPLHLGGEAAENDLLDFLCRKIPDSIYRNLSRFVPGIAVDASRNSGEGDRLAAVLFRKFKAAPVTRFQKGRLAMVAVAEYGARRMDDKFCRKPKPWRDFRLAGLATLERNTRLQQFGACRTMDGAIYSAAT